MSPEAQYILNPKNLKNFSISFKYGIENIFDSTRIFDVYDQ